MVNPLYMVSYFSFAVFNNLSLSLSFDNLFTVKSIDFYKFFQFGNFWLHESRISIFLSRFGRFSPFTGPMSVLSFWDSHDAQPMVHLIVSHKSCRISSLYYYIPFSFCFFDWIISNILYSTSLVILFMPSKHF